MSKSKNIQKKVIQDSDQDSSSQLPLIQTKKQQVKAKKDVKKVLPQSSQEEQTPIVKTKKNRKSSKASMEEEEQPIQKKPIKSVKTQTGAQRKKSIDKQKKVLSSEQESQEQQVVKKSVVKAKSPVQKPVSKKIAKKQSSSEQSEEEQKKVKKPTKSPVQKPISKNIAKKQSSSQQSQQDQKIEKKKVAKSPIQKPKAKKIVKKETSQQESSQQQIKQQKKIVKSSIQKVVTKKKAIQQDSQNSSQEEQKKKPLSKSPLQRPKSPAQKPILSKKKQQESEEDQKIPIRKKSKDSIKVTKKVQVEQPYEECQICVQGLSFNAFDSDIRALFEPCGEILHVNLLMRPDGKPKGTAFVKFNKRSALNKALQLNESQHLGRQIRVQQARGKQGGQGGFNRKQEGGSKFGGNKTFQSNAVIQTPTLFIGGLSYQSTNQSIKDFFSQVGQVQSARVVTQKQTGKPRGFGYVEFYDVQTAKKAYASLNGANLDGRNIRLDSAAQRDRPQNGGFRGSTGSAGFSGNRNQSRNPGNSTVILSQDDKNAKKGAIGTFQGKKIAL